MDREDRVRRGMIMKWTNKGDWERNMVERRK
jgi:hypothetical protein